MFTLPGHVPNPHAPLLPPSPHPQLSSSLTTALSAPHGLAQTSSPSNPAGLSVGLMTVGACAVFAQIHSHPFADELCTVLSGASLFLGCCSLALLASPDSVSLPHHAQKFESDCKPSARRPVHAWYDDRRQLNLLPRAAQQQPGKRGLGLLVTGQRLASGELGKGLTAGSPCCGRTSTEPAWLSQSVAKSGSVCLVCVQR